VTDTDYIDDFLEYTKELPTLEGGHTVNLKISNKDFRVWEDRVDGSITLECLVSGRWLTICEWK
jgi:hypothetical protein